VKKRSPITEEDILLTEALIAGSYARLKLSVVEAPSQVLGSMGKTVRDHPLASAAAAGGAGLLLYGIFDQMNRHGAVKEERREQKSRPDMTMEILSQVIPLVTPYIAGYVENYMKGES
jgi:hypothetical protein